MMKTLALFALLLLAPLVQAQDFFDKGFAQAPSFSPEQADKPAQGHARPSQSTPATEELEDLTGSKPVRSISLLVSGFDEGHLKSVLNGLPSIRNRLPDIPMQVYVVGYAPDKAEAELPRLFLKLIVMGIGMDSGTSIPGNIPVKRSPAWILETQEGDVILEGHQSPEKFLNAKGGYVDRSPEIEQKDDEDGVTF